MKLKYHNPGDVIYQVENYRLRYSGNKFADVELIIFPENNSYLFNYNINDKELPEELRSGSGTDSTLLQKLGLDVYTYGNLKTKEEVLQGAIDLISLIDKKKVELLDTSNFF